MGTLDPVAFLRSLPPFSTLPPALFEEAAGALEVDFRPRGDHLVAAGGEPLRHLYLIRKGVVRLEREGMTLQLLEEGEFFGYTSLITGSATLDATVEEDLLAYRLPVRVFDKLLLDAKFASHFATGLADRFKRSLEHSPVATFQADIGLPVAELVRRPPIWIEPSATVGMAAQVMRDQQVSSVLVRSAPPGILTDRDLRNRVLAEDLGPDCPVTAVYTGTLRMVTADTPLYTAWSELLDAGVHHLPVTRGGEVVGVLTATDLLKCTAQGPMAVLRRVERLADRESLPGYGRKVAEMAAALLGSGLAAAAIAGFVARLNDALLRRLLAWAVDDLGPPPAPFAWVVFGSEGRMEQTLLTDQDNALVYADAGVGQEGWYRALAERVNADLVAAGFPACPGGYMARTWQGPLAEWKGRFSAWIDSPSPKALLEASIFFDFRPVAGTLPLDELEAVIGTSAARPVFLRFLARSALEFKPPPMLLLRLKGASSVVHLKLQAISPIVFLARAYGLEAGCRARGTVPRLEAAAGAGLLDEATATAVTEAYWFLLGLRLRIQLRALAAGRAASNEVTLADLSPVERGHLKDALRAVKAFQDRATFHYRVDF
jgi:CBS domain-containing protein